MNWIDIYNGSPKFQTSTYDSLIYTVSILCGIILFLLIPYMYKTAKDVIEEEIRIKNMTEIDKIIEEMREQFKEHGRIMATIKKHIRYIILDDGRKAEISLVISADRYDWIKDDE